jgi:hypothetical protein
MNVHDLHFDENFLVSIGHDNTSIGNVQEAYHKEPKNPLVVEVMHDDASNIEMHLEICENRSFYGSHIIVLPSHRLFQTYIITNLWIWNTTR